MILRDSWIPVVRWDTGTMYGILDDCWLHCNWLT